MEAILKAVRIPLFYRIYLLISIYVENKRTINVKFINEIRSAHNPLTAQHFILAMHQTELFLL